MSEVGDVIPCRMWFHSDYCRAPGCYPNEREQSHADCDWCHGTKRLRVVESTPTTLVLEPEPAE